MVIGWESEWLLVAAVLIEPAVQFAALLLCQDCE